MTEQEKQIVSAAAKINGKKSAQKFKEKFPTKKARKEEMKRVRKGRSEVNQ